MQKEMHATLGRQVLTWAHAVKVAGVGRVGGSLMYYVILHLSSLGSRASEPFLPLCLPLHTHAH